MSLDLSIQDLKKIYRTTFQARDKWKNIVLELGLSPASIDAIGAKCTGNPDDCYREGLREWLENGHRSLNDLVEALSSPTVDYEDVAIKISREMAVNPVEAQRGGPYRQPITGELVIFTNEHLGTGAFGQVFKGSYRERPCAVKVLHHVALHIKANLPSGQAPDKSVQSFTRECEFLRSFHHPNIVEHLSTERHPLSGNAILVIELMDYNLRSYFSSLGEESLSIDCQISLSKDVASGLAYIHSKKVVHRDLCGDNILLNISGPAPVAKISDFGMSRLLDPSKRSSLTLTAMVHRMGYLPPESTRLQEEEYDHSLDVYSLGVVMMQIALKLETVKTAAERAMFLAQIPQTHVLKPLINKCLQENLSRRPSASQVCTDLGSYDGTIIPQREQERSDLNSNRAPYRDELGEFYPLHRKRRAEELFSDANAHGSKTPRLKPCLDDVLSMDDFSTVHEKLYPTRDTWFNIGLRVGVSHNDLSSIKQNYQDVGERLTAMLAHRLQSGGPLTWRMVCDCLRCGTVGRNDVAEDIEQWCTEEPSQRTLKIHDLVKVYESVKDASPEWLNLGLVLGVKYSALDDLRFEYQHNSDRLREMLAVRLQSGRPLTWDDLCAGLRSEIVARNDVAKKIKEDYQSRHEERHSWLSRSQTTLSLNRLYQALVPAQSKWFSIGLALGVDDDKLSSISKQYKEDCSDCLREMILQRLTTSPPLTIQDVIEALNSPSVCRQDLVEEFFQEI